MSLSLFDRPALLFLPASNPRAIAKARASAADLVVLDLEDAVKEADKDDARAAAVTAAAEDWPMPLAIRINVAARVLPFESSPQLDASLEDCAAIAQSAASAVVVPKVQDSGLIEQVAELTGKPVLAMIEHPYAVLFLRELVGAKSLSGLIAGTNDLAAELTLPEHDRRSSLAMALQTIVCAARVRGIPVWDGVYNRLDDPDGFAAEAGQGRALGFDGKSLIHPDQIAPCQAAFAPSPDQIDRAHRLITAATGGAERFEGEMVEAMHVAAARRLIERARR